MKLYDQTSAIEWFYGTEMTAEEMRGDRRYDQLFREPCVLYDDGAGKVYRFETLAGLAARCAVPQSGPAEVVYERCAECLGGTYRAPGVAEVETIATEAKATADTAAASVNEYMDALLGLNTTDETEAIDAE